MAMHLDLDDVAETSPKEKDELESLRKKLAYAHDDTRRLDFMETLGGEHICQLGTNFYYRAGFGQPHASAKTLRDAIYGAIRLREELK
jgi:hypothetical protein